jgi:hypothetical protein
MDLVKIGASRIDALPSKSIYIIQTVFLKTLI